jgi:hypothetical protein
MLASRTARKAGCHARSSHIARNPSSTRTTDSRAPIGSAETSASPPRNVQASTASPSEAKKKLLSSRSEK